MSTVFTFFILLSPMVMVMPNMQCYEDSDADNSVNSRNFKANDSLPIKNCTRDQKMCLGYGEMHNGVLVMKKYGCFSQMKCLGHDVCYLTTKSKGLVCCCSVSLCNHPSNVKYEPQNVTYGENGQLTLLFL